MNPFHPQRAVTLDENLRRLLAFTCGGPGQPPKPTSVWIAEPPREPGPPRISEESLITPAVYGSRFQQLIEMGFAWLNMNYCGVLRGHGLVLIEYPHEPAGKKGPTSVNFSGPPRCVVDAGWDALAYVTLA